MSFAFLGDTVEVNLFLDFNCYREESKGISEIIAPVCPVELQAYLENIYCHEVAFAQLTLLGNHLLSHWLDSNRCHREISSQKSSASPELEVQK